LAEEKEQMRLRTAADLISILFDEVQYHHDNVLPPPKPTQQQKDALQRIWEEVRMQEGKTDGKKKNVRSG
jgi:hypothetical protein